MDKCINYIVYVIYVHIQILYSIYIYIRINIYLFTDVQCLLVASFLVLWNEWVNHCVNTFALGVQDVVISLPWSTEGEAQLFLS